MNGRKKLCKFVRIKEGEVVGGSYTDQLAKQIKGKRENKSVEGKEPKFKSDEKINIFK